MPDPRTRRRALQLIGTTGTLGLAGCQSNPFADSPTEPTTAANPPALQVSFDVTVERSFTADHPGRLSIELANHEADPLVMGTAHGIEGPFSAVRMSQVEGDANLVILGDPQTGEHETPPGAPCQSDGSAIPTVPTDGCWQPACEFSPLHAHASVLVPANGTLAWPYVILDDFNETCLPAGTYRSSTTAPVSLAPPTPTMGPTPPGGWSHLLEKRVTLELGSDGGLNASAHHSLEAAA